MPAETADEIARPHPTPAGTRIYHWHGGLLLLAETLLLDRPTSPIAATLRIALNKPYEIEVEDRVLTTRATLVGPKRVRRRVTAVESCLALFYLPIERPEYSGLREVLGEEPVVEFALDRFAPVLPALHRAFKGRLSGAEVKDLALRTLQLAAGPVEAPASIDPRIREACRLLATTPLDQFGVDSLAAQVHLSPSRLRNLFKQQIGHPVGEYARWSAIWQAVGLWKPGRSFTEAVMDAGFFDLAHGDRTFVEVFGMSPSLATDSRYVTLIHCE